MKALTLTQPWATLVAIGDKHIETRSWGTRYRGPLAIHAAKGFPRNAIEGCFLVPFSTCLTRGGFQTPADLPRGQIIATCRLAECYQITPTGIPPEDTDEWWFGDYAIGRYAWILTDVVALPEPIPARGALGLWDWSQP